MFDFLNGYPYECRQPRLNVVNEHRELNLVGREATHIE